jgi:hypothetical protein
LTVVAVPLYWIFHGRNETNVFGDLVLNAAIDIYLLTLAVYVIATLGRRHRHLADSLAKECGGNFPPAAYEYRSRWSLFGLPLIHVRIGDRFDVIRPPVKAWIAIGSSHAVGVIFASGGIAIAPFSFGGIAIGLVPFGALTLGAFSLGAISLGIWSFGGMAMGMQTAGAVGIGWESAQGGLVMAHNFAIGDIAHAIQANNDYATQFFRQDPFSRVAKVLNRLGILMMLAWVVPLYVQSRIITRARNRREKTISPIS